MPLAEYLSRQKKRLQKSHFFRGASKLVIYTVAGQLIAVAFSLVLSRIYSPFQFGLFGILLAFPQLANNLMCLNFNLAVPAPLSDEEGASVAFGAAAIGIAMSFVLSLIFLVFVLEKKMGFGALPAWSCLLVWGLLLLAALTSTLQYWCVRTQKLTQLGESVLAQNLGRSLTQCALGLVLATWPGLALGEMAGRAAQLGRVFVAARSDLVRFRPSAARASIMKALRTHRRFITVLLPPQLFESLYDALPVPLIAALFGVPAAGQFYLMKRTLDLPVAFISRTVGDAFYAKISEYARTDPRRIRRVLVAVFLILTGVSAVALLPLVIFGPSIFSFIFGASWKQAGLMTAIMAPPMMLQIGASPVSRVFTITQKPYLRYPFTLVELAGGVIVFGASQYLKLPLIWAVAGLSGVYFLAYFVYVSTAYVAAGHIESGSPAGDAKLQVAS